MPDSRALEPPSRHSLDRLIHHAESRAAAGALTNFSVAPLAEASSMTAGIGISTDHIGAPLLRAAASTAPAMLGYARMRRLQRREIDAPSR
jgi:hypothetical protein